MFRGVLWDYVVVDILVKREIAKQMLSPSQVEFTPVEP